MSHPRKIHLHGTAVFLTTSVEQGILLPANPLMKFIIWSCLGRAQALFPVKVCHFLVEGTHLHMVLVVDNPSDIKGFMERFKTESAHAINRMLGRKKRTVWCEGYDSPTVLTLEDALHEIVYTYTNPAKDGLERTIDDYPGISSWQYFRRGVHRKACHWVRRFQVPRLKGKKLGARRCERTARRLKGRCRVRHVFKLEPDAWMECFGVTDSQKQREVNAELVRRTREREAAYETERKRLGRGVIGRARLENEGLDVNYLPERQGQQTWCICSDILLRKGFIDTAKDLVARARAILKCWQTGDFREPFPAGLYPPCLPKLSEMLPALVFEI